jgi:prephenate dehydratase
VPTVAIQGERGSFSESAAHRLVGTATVACFESFEEVATAVADRRVELGVLPAENSLVGSVVDLAALLVKHGLVSVREVSVPIRQCLIAAARVELADVREVRSHPVALRQCRGFLEAHPWMRAVETADTAGAVREACVARRADLAAIAGREAAELHGACILAEDIADRPDNVTRFVLFERRNR